MLYTSVILGDTSILSGLGEPPPDAGGEEWIAYFTTSHTALLLKSYLGLLAFCFFLIFVGVLCSALWGTEERIPMLGLFALGWGDGDGFTDGIFGGLLIRGAQCTDQGARPDWQPLSFTYEFSGFFNPVDNPDVATNKAKAGSTIPVKFSLGSDMGLDVFEDGYPRSEQIPNPQVMVDGIEQTVAASSSGLSYDSATGQYTYAWKTDKAWAGQYRQLVVRFDDGTTVRRANFSFMK